MLAFKHSPQSALILLKNENIDIDAIKMKLSEAFCSFNYEAIGLIIELVEKGIESDLEINIDDHYLRKASLFGCVASIIWIDMLKDKQKRTTSKIL